VTDDQEPVATRPWSTVWDGGHRLPGLRRAPQEAQAPSSSARVASIPTARLPTAPCARPRGKRLAHRLRRQLRVRPLPPPHRAAATGTAPVDDLNGYHPRPGRDAGVHRHPQARSGFADRIRRARAQGSHPGPRTARCAAGGTAGWDPLGTRPDPSACMLRAKRGGRQAPRGDRRPTPRWGISAAARTWLAMVRGMPWPANRTGRVNALLQNAGSLVPATHATWDPEPLPRLLNWLETNGTINLHTGELLEHRLSDRWSVEVWPRSTTTRRCATPVWTAFSSAFSVATRS